jgi:glycosyltransferase involved in cell wall biosynthesis
VTVRLGDELPHRLRTARSAAVPRGAERAPYALYVSTLEVRKNHRLLFQVWRRLLAAHGRERIPDLVFVGKRGWLADDFVTELEQSRFLDGKIEWRERVEDDELARLYAGCLFSVYPSFYEGWGLPVAESLAFGKTGVVSSASSLPEVGCDFVDYHDPHDVAGATAAIERAIFDPAHREGRERAIRERFRARTWQETAAEVLARIEPLFAARAAAGIR